MDVVPGDFVRASPVSYGHRFAVLVPLQKERGEPEKTLVAFAQALLFFPVRSQAFHEAVLTATLAWCHEHELCVDVLPTSCDILVEVTQLFIAHCILQLSVRDIDSAKLPICVTNEIAVLVAEADPRV
jgi:hypothetical protein